MGETVISSPGSLSALTSLQVLAIKIGCGQLAQQPWPGLTTADLAAGQVYRQVLEAARQLPLLEELSLWGACLPLDSGEPAWAQLASVPALQRLVLFALDAVPQPPAGRSAPLGAGPGLGITSLALLAGFDVADHSTPEPPPLAPGSLAALLPELQQLDVRSWVGTRAEYSHLDITAALQGHQQLQELRVACGMPWGAGDRRTCMPCGAWSGPS